MDLVAPLLARAQLPSREDQRMPPGGVTAATWTSPRSTPATPHRQGRRQGLAGVERQAELVVVRPPGQLGPAQIGLLVLLRQRQQQRWPLSAGGQAQETEGRMVSA